MRTGTVPCGPGIERVSSDATGSPSPPSAAKPSAATRASTGDISFSGGIPASAICWRSPSAAGSSGMFITPKAQARPRRTGPCVEVIRCVRGAPTLDSWPHQRHVVIASAVEPIVNRTRAFPLVSGHSQRVQRRWRDDHIGSTWWGPGGSRSSLGGTMSLPSTVARRRRHPLRLVAIAAATAGLILAACGGDNSSSSTATTAAATTAAVGGDDGRRERHHRRQRHHRRWCHDDRREAHGRSDQGHDHRTGQHEPAAVPEHPGRGEGV